jgi:hypothetical protein
MFKNKVQLHKFDLIVQTAWTSEHAIYDAHWNRINGYFHPMYGVKLLELYVLGNVDGRCLETIPTRINSGFCSQSRN